MKLIDSLIVWYRAVSSFGSTSTGLSVFARREFALQIEVDVARYHMIALRINLMNISAVTIFLARVVFAWRSASAVKLLVAKTTNVSVESCGKLSNRVEHFFAGRTTTLWDRWEYKERTDRCGFSSEDRVEKLTDAKNYLWSVCDSRQIIIRTALGQENFKLLNGACAHYVMVSKYQWKPFWLATQRDPQNDWTATQNRVNYDVFAQAPLNNFCPSDFFKEGDASRTSEYLQPEGAERKLFMEYADPPIPTSFSWPYS